VNVLRWVPPSLSALAGLYCLAWGIFASSFGARERGGAAFLGVMVLLLALIYTRFNLSQKP
jgi:hypothetical protein